MKHITKKNIIRAIFILFLLYWSYRWGFIGAIIMPLPLAIICMFNFKWEQTMKVRVIGYDIYAEWFGEKMQEGKGVAIEDLSDKDFMEIYKRQNNKWEFNSLKEFQDEFNLDGGYAPMPNDSIIRFFENE